jgi:hypothetical protein
MVLSTFAIAASRISFLIILAIESSFWTASRVPEHP